MTRTSETTRDPGRLTAAVWLVLKRYSAQLRKQPALTAGAIILPALGDILTYYAPPLIIAQLLGRVTRDESLGVRELAPYVAGFAGLWLGGQGCWRVAVASSFASRFAVSKRYIPRPWMSCSRKISRSFKTTTRDPSETRPRICEAVRGRVRRDGVQVATTILPLGFVSVVLWQYSPWLVAVML